MDCTNGYHVDFDRASPLTQSKKKKYKKNKIIIKSQSPNLITIYKTHNPTALFIYCCVTITIILVSPQACTNIKGTT